jgi:hypothetical protein
MITVAEASRYLSRLPVDTELLLQDDQNRIFHIATIRERPIGAIIVAGQPFHFYDDQAEAPAQRIAPAPVTVKAKLMGDR